MINDCALCGNTSSYQAGPRIASVASSVPRIPTCWTSSSSVRDGNQYFCNDIQKGSKTSRNRTILMHLLIEELHEIHLTVWPKHKLGNSSVQKVPFTRTANPELRIKIFWLGEGDLICVFEKLSHRFERLAVPFLYDQHSPRLSRKFEGWNLEYRLEGFDARQSRSILASRYRPWAVLTKYCEVQSPTAERKSQRIDMRDRDPVGDTSQVLFDRGPS